MWDDNVTEWYQSMVKPLNYMGIMFFHAWMLVSYVLFMFVDYVLVVYAWWWSLLSLCCHEEVDDVVVGMS